jgi:choline-sulfatase
MPTLLDMAADGDGCKDVDETDGHSLYSIIANQCLDWNHPVISEFSADGSTGPSRMVLKNGLKYMFLEGEEELLFDLANDPHELNNLFNDPNYKSRLDSLRKIAMDSWDPDDMRAQIAQNQEQRLFIHRVTGGDPTNVYTLNNDDNHKYVRNAGAADTKALARFPYVEPSLPPQLSDH